MPAIPVNRVVDNKRIIGKMEGRGGRVAGKVADPPPPKKISVSRLQTVCRYDRKFSTFPNEFGEC
jgi:hypothetical protein